MANTPRPSAKAARMMASPRIWLAASGFRPMAAAAKPPRMPMPMPGPIDPDGRQACADVFHVSNDPPAVPGLAGASWAEWGWACPFLGTRQ